MELLYAYIRKFRNYENVELPFSNKFIIHYDMDSTTIDIQRNTDYVNIYPANITNINAIVGKNSVGKTNLVDLIGLRPDSRNINEEEYKDHFSHDRIDILNQPKFLYSDKRSVYFFIYYYGNDCNGDDIYVFEGNDIESFLDIIYNKDKVDKKYFDSKYWFSFACVYLEENKKFNYCNDVLYFQINDKRLSNTTAIISFREELNNYYFGYNPTRAEDDYKISIPRRIALFDNYYLSKKTLLLYKYMQRKNISMFRNKDYTIRITYLDFLRSEIEIIKSYTNKSDDLKINRINVLASFIKYFYNSVIGREEVDGMDYKSKDLIDENIKNISVNQNDFNNILNYYNQVFLLICQYKEKSKPRFNDEKINYLIIKYNQLQEYIVNSDFLKFEKDHIVLKIDKYVSEDEFDKIYHFICDVLDEKSKERFKEIELAAYNSFFDCQILRLSDGEQAYLGFYSSLYEQISVLTRHKEKYILLLDEPEARMHPELARNFVSDLLSFLNDYKDKQFQIIISTHSPFILSDILTKNAVFLQKDENGNCHCNNKAISIDTFGANIHDLLKEGFFVDSTIGEYAKEKICKVIDFLKISDKSISKLKIFGQYSGISKNEVKYIINSIGEPIIKNKLDQMYFEKYPDEKNIDKQINDYTNQIHMLNYLINSGKISDSNEIEKIKQNMLELIVNIENIQNKDGEPNDKN